MRIGLALSGGGAKGVASLGVLKALNELEVEISAISGSSSGALMAAFYAYGYNPDEILRFLKETRFYNHVKFAFSSKGIFNIEAFAPRIAELISTNSFNALKIPLTVAATNLNRGKTHYFTEGELIRPLLASAAVPSLFKPVTIDEIDYVDGGLLQNMPAKALRNSCDKVIGLHCNPNDEEFDDQKMNVRRIFERSMLLAISSNVFVQKKYCDVYLEPKTLKTFRVFHIRKFDEIVDIGYRHCMEHAEELIKLKKD